MCAARNSRAESLQECLNAKELRGGLTDLQMETRMTELAARVESVTRLKEMDTKLQDLECGFYKLLAEVPKGGNQAAAVLAAAGAARAGARVLARANVQPEPEPEPELELAMLPGTDPEPAIVSVTFTKPGSLGLKLNPHPVSDHPEVTRINPGTQAEEHPQLRAGLVMRSVGDDMVEGKAYKQVLALVKAFAKIRPLVVTFHEPPTAPTPPPPPTTPGAVAACRPVAALDLKGWPPPAHDTSGPSVDGVTSARKQLCAGDASPRKPSSTKMQAPWARKGGEQPCACPTAR